MRREAIFMALAKQLKAVPGIKTFSRKLLHWSDVPAVEQPALFMTASNQSISFDGYGMLVKRSLPVKLYLYNQNTDYPGLQNDLLDHIEAALQPPSGEEVLTLGNLVSYCRIEGEIETDEGLLGEQSIAIIPISILVP
jgi:hypothetical protein